MENDQVKLLWDFRIQTDHRLDHNRPDIVVLEKEVRECFNVGVVVCARFNAVLDLRNVFKCKVMCSIRMN